MSEDNIKENNNNNDNSKGSNAAGMLKNYYTK